MGQTQPFNDLETNLPEAETSSVIETRYVRMLLELDNIPWFYNTSASAAHWALLAGYLLLLIRMCSWGWSVWTRKRRGTLLRLLAVRKISSSTYLSLNEQTTGAF
jgi:hypothetical protein